MNKHFIDAGANTGQTLQWLARRPRFDGWHVWCIEPSPRHLRELMQNAQGMSHRYDITVCPFGLGPANGLLPFFPKTDPMGDSFWEESYTDHAQENLNLGFVLCPAVVGIRTLLSLIKEPSELVLKLDVEGAEYEILDTLLNCPETHKVTEILVEFHNIRPIGIDSEQLIRAFDAKGISIDMWSCK